ncbi:unnamed protein product [Paramecium sonneborni]|uniref:Uncharacterized protein n=1 Tax=Paramecium sonneborni TaxID=65129 RepID=A0A8S1KQ29_9CILI|nr:unnamed protein product [Paramecium sonneborni]
MTSIQSQTRTRIFESDSETNTKKRPITPSSQSQLFKDNQKIHHLTHNTQFNTPIVQCHYHPDYRLNYTKLFDYLLPLCPQCVTIHQEDHNNLYQPINLSSSQYLFNRTIYLIFIYFLIFQYKLFQLKIFLNLSLNKIVDICNLLAKDIQNVTELKTFINEHYKNQKIRFHEAKNLYINQLIKIFKITQLTQFISSISI